MESSLALLDEAAVLTRELVLASPCPIPREGGVYAWYLKEVPAGVPTEGCLQNGDLTLLNVGIAPRAPPQNGKPPSTQRLCHRVRYHYRRNAEG